MSKSYDENSIRQLNWREAVRNSLGMYIGNSDSEGMQHLAEEIISNAMDEASAGYGKKIDISIDTKTNCISIQDYGRGVPFKKNKDGKYAILEVYQGLHAGGKFDGDTAYKSALGLNGVGGTVTNALSSSMYVYSKREDGECKIHFKDGEGQPEISNTRCKETGTLVSFIPDKAIFGKNTWDVDDLKQKIQYHALLNNGLTFNLIVDDKLIVSYKYENGIKDMLSIKTKDEKAITKPIYNRVILNKGKPDEYDIEYAFQYTDDNSEEIYAFTNGGYNPDEGTHVTGFRSGFTSLINKKARELNYLGEKDDNYSGDIIRRGLVCILSVKMVERPMFAEQTKLKLTSPNARTMCSQAISKLELTKTQAEEILKKIEIEQKAENAAKRAKEAAAKVVAGGKSLNTLKDMPEKLADCPDRNGELFLTEGDSAAGGAKISRNKLNQAVFPLRGKVYNTTTKDLSDVIEHQEIKDILTILGCGIGEKFNIDNLRYKRIIIATDADPDGKHIELLLMSLFLFHLPKLVEAGCVYTVQSPLYKVTNNRGVKYYYSDKEVRDKSGDIVHLKGLGELSPQELYDTTLNPDNRKLIQLKPQDMKSLKDLYTILMGKSSEERQKFILSHKISKYSGEDSFDAEDAEE